MPKPPKFIRDFTAMYDIENELIKAREKFPTNKHLLAALTEEVGELAQALLQMQCEKEKGVCDQDVYGEAIQVASMAIRIAVEGESTLPAYNPEWRTDGKD